MIDIKATLAKLLSTRKFGNRSEKDIESLTSKGKQLAVLLKSLVQLEVGIRAILWYYNHTTSEDYRGDILEDTDFVAMIIASDITHDLTERNSVLKLLFDQPFVEKAFPSLNRLVENSRLVLTSTH